MTYEELRNGLKKLSDEELWRCFNKNNAALKEQKAKRVIQKFNLDLSGPLIDELRLRGLVQDE